MAKAEKCGALWERRKADGQVYYKGEIDGKKVVIWQNGYKERDNQPDLIVYPDLPQEGQEQRQAAPQAPQQPSSFAYAPTTAEDEIPF